MGEPIIMCLVILFPSFFISFNNLSKNLQPEEILQMFSMLSQLDMIKLAMFKVWVQLLHIYYVLRGKKPLILCIVISLRIFTRKTSLLRVIMVLHWSGFLLKHFFLKNILYTIWPRLNGDWFHIRGILILQMKFNTLKWLFS